MNGVNSREGLAFCNGEPVTAVRFLFFWGGDHTSNEIT